MTQYNSLNVKLSKSQLNKLKSSIKNETDVSLRISSSMVGNSNDNTNFRHELLLPNRQVENIRKAFANHSSTDIKLSKTQLSKMIQSGGFLGKLLGPLLKTGLPLMKSVINPLAKSVLISSIRRYFVLIKYKMNNVINKFLLVGDKFMPEMHLRQPQFTYSACGPFTKHEQRIQKFKETGDTSYIYKNELDKACFAHDAAYSDSKDLIKRTVADKILKNRAFNIAKDPK